MAIEETMLALIAALNANTEAHGGSSTGLTKVSKTTSAAAPAKPVKTANATVPKITFEEVKAKLLEVKKEKDKDTALKIVKEAGGVGEMVNIKPARYSAVMDACKAVLEGEEEEAEEEEAEDDDEL